MRTFEILLFLSNIGLLIIPFFQKNSISRREVLITSGISTIFLTIHLIIEGYRVQLLFLYCYTVIMLTIAFVNYFKVPALCSISNIKKVICSVLVTVSLFITAGLMYVFPVFNLPTPTGTFKVGTQSFHFIDQNRDEIFDKTGNGKRELMVQVWYPAKNTRGNPLNFIPDEEILDQMAKNYGLPGFTFEHLRYVTSHSYKNVDISSVQRSYPLIIINPGFGSSRFLHTSQAENLASHGYMVAAIDHTYNTFATMFPDGRITTCKTNEYFSPGNNYQIETENRDKLGKVLTDDVVFALNQFEQINMGKIPTNLKGKFDMSHIGVFGHSIGGATAYDSSYDPRITAGIDLDGGLYRLRQKPGLRKPFLFICSEIGYRELKAVMDSHIYTDEELEKMGVTRDWKDKETQDKRVELKHMRKVIYIANSGHLNFTDVQFFSPAFKIFKITGRIDSKKASTIVNSCILDFFDGYLKNKNRDLPIGLNRNYTEVKDVTKEFSSKREWDFEASDKE